MRRDCRTGDPLLGLLNHTPTAEGLLTRQLTLPKALKPWPIGKPLPVLSAGCWWTLYPLTNRERGTTMKQFRLAADLVPFIVAECNSSSTTLIVVARLDGGEIEFTVLEAGTTSGEQSPASDIPAVQPQSAAGDTNTDSTASTATDIPPLNKPDQLPPVNEGPQKPENLHSPSTVGIREQFGLPLHPEIPQSQHLPTGDDTTSRVPVVDCRPVDVRLLNVDARRGCGYVGVGRAVRRAEIEGTLPQLRQLHEYCAANNPELSVVGRFDVSNGMPHSTMSLRADDLLVQIFALRADHGGQ